MYYFLIVSLFIDTHYLVWYLHHTLIYFLIIIFLEHIQNGCFKSDFGLYSQAVSAFFPDVRVMVSNGECHLLRPVLGLIIVICWYINEWLGHFSGFSNIPFL